MCSLVDVTDIVEKVSRMTRTIYIVLTETGTLLSKAIGMYTGKGMNHASISFDSSLYEMYSFGRVNVHNPLSGGFLRENAETGLFEYAQCAIYKIPVSYQQYIQMKQLTQYMHGNRNQYKYNFLGLFGVVMQKELRRERAFFCSQFVATILKIGGLPINHNPALMTPHCLAQLPFLEPVYYGRLSDYLQEARTPIAMFG